MSVLSAALGAAGASHTITHAGVTYPFVPFGQAMKDAFQKELYRLTREQAACLPEVTDAPDPAAALDAELAALKRQFLAGGFRMESQAGRDFLSRQEGKTLLLTLIVKRPPGQPDEDFAAFLKARGVEVGQMIDLVLCESMPGYAAVREKRQGTAGPAEGNGRTPPVMRPPPGAREKRRKGKKTRK